jgi:hypothetical protein
MGMTGFSDYFRTCDSKSLRKTVNMLLISGLLVHDMVSENTFSIKLIQLSFLRQLSFTDNLCKRLM